MLSSFIHACMHAYRHTEMHAYRHIPTHTEDLLPHVFDTNDIGLECAIAFEKGTVVLAEHLAVLVEGNVMPVAVLLLIRNRINITKYCRKCLEIVGPKLWWVSRS
jgi:hypothetical protein